MGKSMWLCTTCLHRHRQPGVTQKSTFFISGINHQRHSDMADGTILNECKVLFNATGGNGANTGTLSESIYNFHKIKVYFGNADGGYQGSSEYLINARDTTYGNSFNEPMALYFPGNGTVNYHFKRLAVASNGVSFSTDRPVTMSVSSNGSVSVGTSANRLVYRVEGYR